MWMKESACRRVPASEKIAGEEEAVVVETEGGKGATGSAFAAAGRRRKQMHKRRSCVNVSE
jgi:hypothetical protein